MKGTLHLHLEVPRSQFTNPEATPAIILKHPGTLAEHVKTETHQVVKKVVTT